MKFDEKKVEEFLAAYDAWFDNWCAATPGSCYACYDPDKPQLMDRMILGRDKLRESSGTGSNVELVVAKPEVGLVDGENSALVNYAVSKT